MRYTAAEAASAAGGRLVGPDVGLDGMSFDSRSLVAGQLFVPIVAERDGHDFLPAALRAGATAYLTAGPIAEGATAIVVDDTLMALGRIAAAIRPRFGDRVIGITGSVGKTSCKDMTAAVLGRVFRTAASVKSYNNDQGLPHTLLNAPDDVEALVLEMGMRGFGEITRLCNIGHPRIGVITAIAPAHTERVGGIEGVIRAKGELIEALPSSGHALLNGDDANAMRCADRASCPVLTFGASGDVRVVDLTLDERACASFTLATPWGSTPVRVGVPGAHMASNAAAAAAVGLLCGVPLDEVAAGLAETAMSPWRMELHRLSSGASVLNDAYNANPASMRAALDTLAALTDGRRIAVLGTMAELADPAAEHRNIASYAAERGVIVIPVGTLMYGTEPAADPVGAVGRIGAGDAVLVKGSRVAGLETVAAALIERADADDAAGRSGQPGGASCDTSTQCGWCGGQMRPEHAHYRCTQCGQRDSCCDGPY